MIGFIGWLYDGTGSYDISFIVAGVVVAFSGIMLFFIPLVRRCLNLTERNVRGYGEEDVAIDEAAA